MYCTSTCTLQRTHLFIRFLLDFAWSRQYSLPFNYTTKEWAVEGLLESTRPHSPINKSRTINNNNIYIFFQVFLPLLNDYYIVSIRQHVTEGIAQLVIDEDKDKALRNSSRFPPISCTHTHTYIFTLHHHPHAFINTPSSFHFNK